MSCSAAVSAEIKVVSSAEWSSVEIRLLGWSGICAVLFSCWLAL